MQSQHGELEAQGDFPEGQAASWLLLMPVGLISVRSGDVSILVCLSEQLKESEVVKI